MSHKTTLKLEKYLNTRGIFLKTTQYAILRGEAVQTIREELNENHPRKPYSKTIILPKEHAKKKDGFVVFVSGEKPLYDYNTANFFRLEKMIQGKVFKIEEESNEKGYWLSTHLYAEFLGIKTQALHALIKSNNIELGQIYRQNEEGRKEYRFFIPISPPPFDYRDVLILKLKIDLYEVSKGFSEIISDSRSKDNSVLGKIFQNNPKFIETLSAFSKSNLNEDKIESLAKAADGFNRLFK